MRQYSSYVRRLLETLAYLVMLRSISAPCVTGDRPGVFQRKGLERQQSLTCQRMRMKAKREPNLAISVRKSSRTKLERDKHVHWLCRDKEFEKRLEERRKKLPRACH